MLAEWQLWASDAALLAPETCQQVVEACLQLPAAEATAGGAVNPAIRNCEVRWLAREQWPEMYDFVKARIETANRNAFGFDLSYLPDLQFTTYGEERLGHYSWHPDVFWTGDPQPKATHRKVSAVVQLSEPATYAGGDLALDVPIRPEAALLRRLGAMIVFPSFIHHHVTPVTKGTRHSLVAWYEGPKWR